MEIVTHRLLEARTGVQKLIADALSCLGSRSEADESWLDEFISHRVPTDDAGYWLLAARATQDRAIGVAEAWLDHPNVGDDVRAHLMDLLSALLATGDGAELTQERLRTVIADALDRTVDVHELAAPIAFSLAILTLTSDATTHTTVTVG